MTGLPALRKAIELAIVVKGEDATVTLGSLLKLIDKADV